MVSSWSRLLAATGLLFLTALSAAGLLVLLKRTWKLLKFLFLLRRSRDLRAPARAIRSSCQGALALLALKGFRRKNNEELLAYAARLRPDLAEEAERLFRIFYQSEYRSQLPDAADAEKAALSLSRLRARLKNN